MHWPTGIPHFPLIWWWHWIRVHLAADGEALGGLWQRTLATLDPGDISQPSEVVLLDGRRAWHIVRLDERIASHRVDIENDYELIEQRALQDKQARVMEEWMQELRQSVYLDYRGDAEAPDQTDATS